MKNVIFLLALLGLLGCASADTPPPEEVRKRISAGATVVDVRTKDEFESGHLDGALNVPHTELEARVSEFGEDKAAPIVVYCRSGRRSGVAKEVLETHGYTNVTNGGGYSDLR